MSHSNTAPVNIATAKSESQWQIVLKQFQRNPLARFGIFILVILYAIAILAPFIAPYPLSEYSTTAGERVSWVTPTKIHWQNEQGQWTRPYVYAVKREINLETFRDEYIEDTSKTYPIQFFVRDPEHSYKILGFIPGDIHLFGVQEPAKIFLWGSDNLGRDQFSRMIYGSQISMSIGILATVFSLVVGLFMGGIAGYFGGWVDIIVMRMVEVLSAIPSLFLLITIRALFPVDADPIFMFYVVVCMLAFVGWGGLARVVRSQFMSAREQDFVQAARALGASDTRIIVQHMLPTAASYIIITASIAIPGYILFESSLSFLGIGIVEPYASWGSLLKQAQDGGFESITGRPWTLLPGMFIFFAVLAWQLVGDGLRDAFDPRRRR